jgi:hypothetical protein
MIHLPSRILLASVAAISLLLGQDALANFLITQGSGTTVFSVDGANQGTSLCAAATTECMAQVPINSAGTPIGVSANPFFVTGAGGTFPVTGTFWQTTQPVSAVTLPLPSGAATAANQEVTVSGTSATSAQGVQGVTGGVAMPVTPKTASFNFPGCTITTSSTQCLAAATAINHLEIQNTSGTASIACSFGGTAVLNSAGSITLASLQSALWGPTTAGVPSAALNCISSATATLYIEYN